MNQLVTSAHAAVNIVYTVYDPQHKQVNAGGIKCLWLYFRHLQYTIHRGLLSTGKRMWLSLDIPVLRKPHLTRSRGCEETDAAAKALKNRPVNWLSDVTGFSVHQESTQGQVRSICKPCQMTGRCGSMQKVVFNVIVGLLYLGHFARMMQPSPVEENHMSDFWQVR